MKSITGLGSLIRYILVVFSVLGYFAFALASPENVDKVKPNIQGQWIQGAMLTGHVEPGTYLEIFGRQIKTNKKGEFVFGLGRDTPEQISIIVKSPSGLQTTYSYQVKQRKYKTQRINGVDKKYVSPPPEVTKRIKRDAQLIWKARQAESDNRYFAEGFRWPAKGPISGVYGSQRIFNGVPKRPHYGLDIAGPIGEKVYAPAGGIVSLVHTDMYYSGGTIILDHGQGVSSTFIHLSKILVGEGDTISKGQLIAEIGATGRVTGPHLDWRINWFDQRLDPQLVLPARE